MDGRTPDTARAHRALTIEEIAALTQAKPRAGDPLDRRISNIAPLDTAVAADISFLDKARFLDALAATRAGACFISPPFEAKAPPGLAILVTPEPYRAFVAVTRALFPEALRPSSLFGVKGRSKDDVIASFETRLKHDAAAEFAEALRQIERITLLRLKDRLP